MHELMEFKRAVEVDIKAPESSSVVFELLLKPNVDLSEQLLQMALFLIDDGFGHIIV